MTTVAVFPLSLVRLAIKERPSGSTSGPVAVRFRPFSAETARTVHCGPRTLAGEAVVFWNFARRYPTSSVCYIDQQGGQHWPA